MRRGRSQRGLALVAVLWMVAALALLAAALAGGTRAEVRVLHAYESDLRALAAGDAAIHLVAMALRATQPRPDRLVTETVRFDGLDIQVRVLPASGFVDLNSAPETLLRDLFEFAGGADPGEAAALAAEVLAWRDRAGQVIDPADAIPGGRRVRFDVVEDLLLVPGVSLDLFDRIRDLVTTSSGAAGINPLAADGGALLVLAAGDAGLANTIAARRDAEDPLIDMTRLNSLHLASGASGGYRLDALVPSPDGSLRVRSAWLSLSSDRRGSPWRLFGAGPIHGLAGARGG